MKKLIIFLILAIFFVISCGNSKKTENDADLMPDEDETDVDENEESEKEDEDDEDEDEDEDDDKIKAYNPCRDLDYTDGTVTYKEDGTFDCECIENYFWNGTRCTTPCKCKGLANSDGKCSATSMKEYSCGCVNGYFWNGKKCVNPCIKASCKDFEHSTGKCRGENAFYYTCGCVDGFYWWGTTKGCIETKPGPAHICTGADKCYSTWEEIKCRESGEEFYGQDADYAAIGFCVPRSFSTDSSVENEPVIIDNNLKIEWMYKFSDSIYPWYNAVKYCEDIEYGGHNDWRLPSPQELMTYPPLSNADEELYLWSSKSVHGNDPYAWKINYPYKSAAIEPKTAMHNVRCVRGEPIDTPTSFKSIDSNLVMDYKNGLMWSTANYTREKMWNEALTECEKSTASGFSDWRLPNINELATLMNFEKNDPASDFPYPEDIPVYLWSSTTLESNIEESPGVTIYGSGEIKNLRKSGVEDNKNHVVCVRNELCKENYFWNGVDCVESPCSGDPCKDAEHSDGICHFESTETYSCGCVENYFWDGTKCMNPCDTEPCKNHEHSDNKCEPRDKMRYTCGCEEGFWWWGQNKGCLERKPDLAHICTGQTKCYDDEKEIECPEKGEKFYGQDAQYADLGYCAPPNYTIEKKIENEPVVIDNYTGLSWQQNVYSPGASVPWSNYKNYCSNSTYGGYDDWRLPGVWEYKSIMDFGRFHPNVDPKYFPDTPPEYFITSVSTSYSCGELPHITPATKVAWIKFDHIETGYYSGWCDTDPPINGHARCVRGKAEGTSQLKIAYSVDVTVTIDKKFGILMTSWDYYAPSMKWADAFDYCENLTYAGLSDWRLMNTREIQLFSGGQTSTSAAYDPTKAEGPLWKEITFEDVRCIRDNPCKNDEVWFESKCMKNPCVNNPCAKKANSDGACQPINEELYSCRCGFYYYWNAESMKCVESCKKSDCKYTEHSDKQCYEDDPKGYRCGCEEGYTWDFDSKKCLDDNETDDDSNNDADSIETPDIDADNITVSDTDIAETPDETNDTDEV